jgi:hypothetical protein
MRSVTAAGPIDIDQGIPNLQVFGFQAHIAKSALRHKRGASLNSMRQFTASM